jgi:hypothetical protein
MITDTKQFAQADPAAASRVGLTQALGLAE